MPYSSGTFSLYTPGNPVVTGTTIASTWANNTLNDIATGLTTCLLKDGSQTVTANIPMSSFKFTGLGAGSAAGNSVRWEQSAPGVVTAAGDLVIASASGAVTKLAVGTAGTVPMSIAAATNKVSYVAALNKAIYGLTYSNDGSDATNDIDIATGGAMDATGAYWMTLGSALVKQSDVAWAVGTNAGMLDAGTVGNSDYYIWLIARSDTGVVDVLSSLSSTAPTMPSNYDFKRLIGWFKRVGGTVVAFHTYETEGGGLEHNWDAPTLDINSNSLTSSRLTSAVKVPQNFSTQSHLRVHTDDAGGAIVILQCPDETDAAPSASAAPLATLVSGPGLNMSWQGYIRTSATGTISARATAAVDNYLVSTVGFRWARRN